MKNNMIIGIDLDDTITITKEYMEEAARLFDEKINGNGIIDNTKYLVGERYGWSEERKEDFFKNYRIDAINKARVRDDAILYLNKLINLGYEILIITARSDSYYDNPYEYTKKWLDDRNIPYTKLIVNSKDKKEVCCRENVSIFVDDMPSNCQDVNSLGNIKVFIMDNEKNLIDNKEITRIKTFKELYENILN